MLLAWVSCWFLSHPGLSRSPTKVDSCCARPVCAQVPKYSLCFPSISAAFGFHLPACVSLRVLE